MKDPADELTPELPVLVERMRVVEMRKQFFVSIDGDNFAGPFRLAETAQAYGDILTAPRRVRKGGASRSAARSADKPERGER